MTGTDVIFYDASGWTELSWYNSGGTRAKRVLLSPDGAEWYFKCSEKKLAKDEKPEKYYKYEFWSEVIASQLGLLLGLDVLRYDVAVHNGEIGCISPLMIKRDEEQLLEVGRYMTALNEDFLPENRKTRNEYSFELLERTLGSFNLTEYWPQFFATIIFDAIIGNTDRHQENWAFIGKASAMGKALHEMEVRLKGEDVKKRGWLYRNTIQRLFDSDKNELNTKGQQIKLFYTNIIKMAPIYDSGSSLGRELNDERVSLLLANEPMLLQYVNKGQVEIHWQKKKITHLELIHNLLSSSYLEEMRNAAGFLNRWEDDQVDKIINNIDRALPANWHSYRIPESRKNLMLKLLTLRSQKMKELIGYDGV